LPILHIEHRVADFDRWKENFDSDPVRREESRVRRYWILRGIDDPNLVMIDLEFDTASDAEALLAVLRELWREMEPAGLIDEAPHARIVETVETKEY
jgi:cytidylate kinase